MAARQNVFLIGPMGSGKTAVGRQLARLLDYPFYDSDHEIEQRTGAEIALIFEREGEAGFRRREHEVIVELTALKRIVLATGGGAILDADNRRHLAERGWIVYLETSLEQQAERAGRSRHRPLLQGGDPRRKLEELMLVREPLYRASADLTLSTSGRHVSQVAERIAREFQKTLATP
jgi:shikimate kinase